LQQSAGEKYLSITATDIQQAFVTALRPDDLAVVIKGPPP
jgi:hypothetical protein